MAESLQLALAAHRAGDIAGSLHHYEAALAAAPNDIAALFYGGVAAWSGGQLEIAHARLVRAISVAPEPRAELHYHLALVFASLKNPDEAKLEYQRAVSINSNFAPALNNLGELLRVARDYPSAEENFVRAIAANPQLLDARFNRGVNAHQAGNLALAQSELSECVKLDPDNAKARAALIHALIDSAAQTEALTLARASAKRLPNSVEIWGALAQAEQTSGNIDAARKAYAAGLSRSSSQADLALNAAFLEHENCNDAGAREIYESLRTDRLPAGVEFRLATMLPTIPSSEAEIDRAREALHQNVLALTAKGLVLEDPLNEFGHSPFYLSYHGRSDDAQVLSGLSQALRKCAPSLNFRAPHLNEVRQPGKWRIGFLSHFLFDHSVGRSVAAFIRGLSRHQFDVFVIRTPPFFRDTLANRIDEHATCLNLANDLQTAQHELANLQLDALVIPEIGMDSFTYLLAHARLAPVQWTTLGHPCTSGLSSIDGYLSFSALEPPGSERFYSEALVRIPEGSIYPAYEPPAQHSPSQSRFQSQSRSQSQSRNRASLGFNSTDCLMICPQSLFKLMPQFDAVLRGILERVPHARILLPESKMPGQTSALKSRLQTSIGKHIERVTFFATRPRAEFVDLLNACDIMLDPFPVGGGITTWDALITGIPIVTLPSELMRSRFAMSALVSAEITETIAVAQDDYINIVTRLASDASARAALRTRMREKAGDIYRDDRAVAHFSALLTHAINAAVREPAPQVLH